MALKTHIHIKSLNFEHVHSQTERRIETHAHVRQALTVVDVNTTALSAVGECAGFRKVISVQSSVVC